MGYPTDHKERTRQQLLEDSGRHVKKHGFAASGVDAIPLRRITSGALYKHSPASRISSLLWSRPSWTRTASRFAAVQAGGPSCRKRALAAYLVRRTSRAADAGCPLPALTAEITRAVEGARSVPSRPRPIAARSRR